MKEELEVNKNTSGEQGLSLYQTIIQDSVGQETPRPLDTDYLEEWKERAFKKEILRLFIDYYCVKHHTPLKEIMNDVEKTLLVRVLALCNGNQAQAAKILKTRTTTLNEKVKRFNIRFKKNPQ